MTNKRKKAKILYLITQSELGGAQKYVFDLASGLKNNFKVVVGFGEQGESGELAKQLKQAGIAYCVLPDLKRQISPIKDFLALGQIIKLIIKEKPDLIHLNSSKISILASLAAWILKIFPYQIRGSKPKIIYTVHGWVFNEPLPRWKKLFYKYAEKLTAGVKDKLICVSETDRQIALSQKIAPKNKLNTIYNGIQPIKFIARDQAKEKLFSLIPQLVQAPPVILGSIGNLYPTKGFSFFIQAVKILNQKKPKKYAAIIIGEGQERKKLEKLITKLNLTNSIFLPGRLTSANRFLKAFDIYISSSLKEGLSYTIIEAMLAGLPIVATHVGGTPELIEDDITGRLVKPGDSMQLAKTIASLTGDREKRKKLSASAQNFAASNLTLSQMLKQTKNLYLNLIT
jgi:glycosyltransferase involved in cell wall biosynthesis